MTFQSSKWWKYHTGIGFLRARRQHKTAHIMWLLLAAPPDRQHSPTETDEISGCLQVCWQEACLGRGLKTKQNKTTTCLRRGWLSMSWQGADYKCTHLSRMHQLRFVHCISFRKTIRPVSKNKKGKPCLNENIRKQICNIYYTYNIYK